MSEYLVVFLLVLCLDTVSSATRASAPRRTHRSVSGASPDARGALALSGNPASDSRPMPRDFTVAFIADTDLSPDGGGRAVLELVRREGAQLVMHQGDFDYLRLAKSNSPAAGIFDSVVSSVLGRDFPLLGAVGNNDVADWKGRNGYQQLLYDRLVRSGHSRYCTGVVGESLICSIYGLIVVQSATPLGGSHEKHASFINQAFLMYEDRLAARLQQDGSSPPVQWRVCAWHLVARDMNTGKLPRHARDDPGELVYEACRKHGAMIATGHDHVYARSHLLESYAPPRLAANYRNRASDDDELETLRLGNGKSFVFVNGLGGMDVRPAQDTKLRRAYWARTVNSLGVQGSIPPSRATSNQADFGALFCVLNRDGVSTDAECYFKTTQDFILDRFRLEAPRFAPAAQYPVKARSDMTGSKQNMVVSANNTSSSLLSMPQAIHPQYQHNSSLDLKHKPLTKLRLVKRSDQSDYLQLDGDTQRWLSEGLWYAFLVLSVSSVLLLFIVVLKTMTRFEGSKDA